jgi:RHS repeat-associated protein
LVTADGSTLVNNDIKAPKNGYTYVYISNQSNLDVFFDNLKVQVVTGNIIEENHYYAYGLKIAAISSKKLPDTYEGVIKNNYLYQSAYSEMDDDIGWNDFKLRNYDSQIGRWVQGDPYQQFASPYIGLGNNPIINIDPDGGFTGVGGMLVGIAIGFAAPYVVEAITGKHIKNKGLWAIGGALLGAGIGYAVNVSLVSGTHVLDGSKNFWQNFKAFYAGLFNPSSGGTALLRSNINKSSAIIPRIYGGIGFTKILPKWDLWRPRSPDGYSGFGFIYRVYLTFPYPIWPLYNLLRQVIHIPYFKR